MVDDIPHSVFKYGLSVSADDLQPIVSEFVDRFPFLLSLQLIQKEPHDQQMLTAFALGELQIIQYLRETGCKLSPECATECARNGHAHCLKHYYDSIGSFPEDLELTIADSGQADCLKVLQTKGYNLTYRGAVHALRRDHVNCLQLYHERA